MAQGLRLRRGLAHIQLASPLQRRRWLPSLSPELLRCLHMTAASSKPSSRPQKGRYELATAGATSAESCARSPMPPHAIPSDAGSPEPRPTTSSALAAASHDTLKTREDHERTAHQPDPLSALDDGIAAVSPRLAALGMPTATGTQGGHKDTLGSTSGLLSIIRSIGIAHIGHPRFAMGRETRGRA
jgi:hypothetical protein